MICVFHSEDFPPRRLTEHVCSVPSGLRRYNLLSFLHYITLTFCSPSSPQDYSVPEISLFPEENAEGKKVIFRDTSEDARIFGFPIKATSIIINAGLWVKLRAGMDITPKKLNFSDINPLTLWLNFIRFENCSCCFYLLSSGGSSTHIPSSRVCRVSWRLAGTPTPPPGGWNHPTWDQYIRSKS